MITMSKITIGDEVIDIAAIEANARKMRAEAMAGFGRSFRTWVKGLFVGQSARAAH